MKNPIRQPEPTGFKLTLKVPEGAAPMSDYDIACLADPSAPLSNQNRVQAAHEIVRLRGQLRAAQAFTKLAGVLL